MQSDAPQVDLADTISRALKLPPAEQIDLLAARRASYVEALRQMDWQFEYADDHRAWKRGSTELERLRREQAVVDADGSLWRRHAPESFHNHLAAVA